MYEFDILSLAPEYSDALILSGTTRDMDLRLTLLRTALEYAPHLSLRPLIEEFDRIERELGYGR